MYKTTIKILVIIALAFLQFAFFSKISFFGAFPNIIVILAVALLVQGHRQDAFLVGGIGGLILDFVSPLRFGIYTFLIIAALLLINFIFLKYLPAPNLLSSFLIFAGVFLFINLGLALFIMSWPGWSIVIDAGINGIWGILIYWMISKVNYTTEIEVV